VLKFFNIIQLIAYPLTSLIIRYALVMQLITYVLSMVCDAGS